MARSFLNLGHVDGPPKPAKTLVSYPFQLPFGGRERATFLPAGGSSGRAMTDNHADTCDFCRRGRVIKRNEDIGFYQWTDKGYLYCRATVPLGACDQCGMKSWDEASESIIEEAIRRAYDRR